MAIPRGVQVKKQSQVETTNISNVPRVFAVQFLISSICMMSSILANNDSESDVGAQEELVAEKYMRAPADASLADKGRAKGKKAIKRAGATALQGFRKYSSPSGIPVSTSLTPLPHHHVCLCH